MKLRIALLTLIVLVPAVIGAHRASALTLVPPSLEFSTQPGKTIETTVKLYNETTDPVNVYTSTALFTAKDESGTPNFQFTDAPTDLASWVTVAAGPIGIQPGERVEIPVSLVIPANAEPGGHYAGLFFETRPPADTAGQVRVRQKIGSLLIVRVEGEVLESASIAGFGLTEATLNRLPADFVIRVQNNGNVHIRPSGTVTVRNMMGGVTVVLPLNPKDGAVLPNSIRRFELQWSKHATSATRGNFLQEIGAEWQNFALGTYTAEVAATYGTTGKTLNQTIHITVMPWHVLSAALVAIILLILFFVVLLRWYNRMIIRKAQNAQQKNS